MQDTIAALFSGVEAEKRKELLALQGEWEQTVHAANPDKWFMYDGFLPGYYSAPVKALFIGREARHQDTHDYVANTITFTKQGAVSGAIYWKRVLCMANIIKNKGVFDKAASADTIARSMVETNNYGFAVMNISKYLNDSEHSETRDTALMNQFFADSKLDDRNFLREEIALLDPDIILTANLWCCGINENLQTYFGTPAVREEAAVESQCAAALNDIAINGKTIKLIDFYHFSNHFKNDADYYYNPLARLLKSVL